MIRTMVVDDHPALRSGLVASLRLEPGLVPVTAAGGVSQALAQATRRDSLDVAVVDYNLGDGNGLLLCHELKQMPSPPAVLIYSAFAGRELAVAAAVAGADGLVDKAAPLDELWAAMRTVARGGKALPPLEPGAVAERLYPEDLPILGMRIDGVELSELAAVLRVEESQVSRQVVAMLSRLVGVTGGEAGRDAVAEGVAAGRRD